MSITLTYVGKNNKGNPRQYDTDDTAEALAEAVRTWFGDGRYPEENSVIAVVIERDDHKLTTREVSKELNEIYISERHRAHLDEMKE